METPRFQEGIRNRNREAYIARLHDEAPLYKDELGFWIASRFADAQEVLRDPRRFSSQAMDGGRLTLPLVTDDPPRHSQLRSLVSKAFTPSRVAAMRPQVEALAESLVASIDNSREVDIVEALTVPLPVTVIARMLGIPEEDGERFKQWSNAVTGLMGGPLSPDRTQGVKELREYFLNALADRRATPGDDLLSALASAEEAGVQLSDEEVVGFSILLLVAGNETTTNLLGSLLHRLATDGEHWSRLKADPTLVPEAIEEALRLDSPAQFVIRRATQDTTIGEHPIAEGDRVFVFLTAANRDPARWDSPAQFDPSGEQNRHVAFGFGIHTCIGAPLARLEAQAAMTALLNRFDTIRLGQERVRRLPGGILFGIRVLPLVLG